MTTDLPGDLHRLRDELETELTDHILPYWMTVGLDRSGGGFAGYVTEDSRAVQDAPKGAILNARILWTFSAAFRRFGTSEYVDAADRAYEYIVRHFVDGRDGGVYWMVDAAGAPLDQRKHVYAQAFALYAFSEFHVAAGRVEALEHAIEQFELIEARARDAANGGYHEAFSREWQLLEDVRLSDKDADERRSMNTHLHLLEAYSSLFRIWPDRRLGTRLRDLVELFLTRIIDPETAHLITFFDDRWRPRSSAISFGHDIEASWLLLEAADVLGEPVLRERVKQVSLAIAGAVLASGVDDDGGLMYEAAPSGVVDGDKHWWPQAEAIVGFLVAYLESGNEAFATAAVGAWEFTKRCIVDRRHGEWFVRARRDGRPYLGEEKIGPWKCPYHNARACLEVMHRVDTALEAVPVNRNGRERGES